MIRLIGKRLESPFSLPHLAAALAPPRFLPDAGAAAFLLINRYDVPRLKARRALYALSANQHTAFLAFLTFLKGNLGGQTSLRVDNTWASQGILLHAITDFAIPDRVIREDDLTASLAETAKDASVEAPPMAQSFSSEAPFDLAEIHDDKIEKAIRAAYQRDFMMFGFDRWDAA